MRVMLSSEQRAQAVALANEYARRWEAEQQRPSLVSPLRDKAVDDAMFLARALLTERAVELAKVYPPEPAKVYPVEED